MQIKSNTPLNDEASIVIGMSILKPLFEEHYYPGQGADYWVKEIAEKYNPSPDEEYAREIKYIYNELIEFTGIDI